MVLSQPFITAGTAGLRGSAKQATEDGGIQVFAPRI